MARKSFNDKMMARTVLPVIYVWIAAAASVVYTGITKPDVVLQNLDGFIALIAIIGGVALPALNTLLRTLVFELNLLISPAFLQKDFLNLFSN